MTTLAPKINLASIPALQTALNKLGASPQIPVNGAMGAPTIAAIKAFQERAKVRVTGKLDPATTAAIKKALGVR